MNQRYIHKTMCIVAAAVGLFAAASLHGQEEPASNPETRAPASQNARTPSTVRLDIHAVDSGPFASEDAAMRSVSGPLPATEEILPYSGSPSSASGTPYYVIERSPIVAGSDFRSIQPDVDPNTGQTKVDFTLTDGAAKKFLDYTSANIGKSMAVVMGGTVRVAAAIRARIRGSGEIEGSFTRGELMELAQTAPAASTSPATAPAQTSLSGHPNNAYWIEHDRQLLMDFGGLAHFKEADTMLGAAKTGEDRVVFMGDSITQGWKLDEAFPGKPYVNRGISGQTTPQMLVRFRQDVIDLKPKVVVILAGTNDIAGNTGPMTLEQTEGNLASMAELAAANGIRVVLCSVLPAFDYPWSPGLTPAPKIAQINAWLKNYAEQKGYVYVDFYSVMKDDRGGLPANLSRDGVHPLPAGFAVMSPLAEAGIEKALK